MWEGNSKWHMSRRSKEEDRNNRFEGQVKWYEVSEGTKKQLRHGGKGSKKNNWQGCMEAKSHDLNPLPSLFLKCHRCDKNEIADAK